MSDEAPLVTVVIPTYNAGRYLDESVASVLAQTMADVDLIVVDDGSTDGSTASLPADERIRVIRQMNQGVAAARNRGAQEARAGFVAFLDADDRWLPAKLERQLAALNEQPDALLCYTAYAAINPDGESLSGTIGGDACTYLSLFESNPIPMSSVLIRRDVLLAAGGFDRSYSTAADWDLWLRLAEEGPFCCVLDRLTEYRIAPHNIGQMSGDPWLSHLEVSSILDRHELRAMHARDRKVLAAIARGRKASRTAASAHAIGRFVDSLGWTHAPEWNMARAAIAIDPAEAFRRSVRLMARRARRAFHRPSGGNAHARASSAEKTA